MREERSPPPKRAAYRTIHPVWLFWPDSSPSPAADAGIEWWTHTWAYIREGEHADRDWRQRAFCRPIRMAVVDEERTFGVAALAGHSCRKLVVRMAQAGCADGTSGNPIQKDLHDAIALRRRHSRKQTPKPGARPGPGSRLIASPCGPKPGHAYVSMWPYVEARSNR
jgi:hypothetical protein